MSKFTAAKLLHKPQFCYLTGTTPDIFCQMVERLAPSWKRRERRKERSGRPHGVGGLEEHLLLLLMVYRCHLSQDLLSCLFDVDKSTVCRSLQRIEKLARRILGVKRSIKVTAEEAQALLIDATEQTIERQKRAQKRYYSGKKKRHPLKYAIIATEQGRIVCVSKSAPGTVHDITIRRRGPPLPENARGYADSGYQGYQEDHPNLDIPYKSSKNRPLTKDEKQYNRALSSFRIRAEHTIRRVKIFRIFSDRYRYPRPSHTAKIAIAAGIANLIAGV
jgi:IS5 family transposase